MLDSFADYFFIFEPTNIYWGLIIFGVLLLIILTLILVLFGIPPGIFLIFITLLIIGFCTSFNRISYLDLFVIFIISLIVEILEFFLGGILSKKFGGNTKSSIASIIGGIAGGIILGFFLPIIGGIIGVFGGAFAASYFTAKKTGMNHEEAMQASWGSIIGNLLSKWIKAIIIIFMGFYILYLYWGWTL